VAPGNPAAPRRGWLTGAFVIAGHAALECLILAGLVVILRR
jgi:hypothetical protein